MKGATAYTGSGASLQIGFNPRAREGRDRKRLRELLMSKLSFNPRAREGRDAYDNSTVKAYDKFQSTRPRGARLAHVSILASEAMFQSTRPRGARLFM